MMKKLILFSFVLLSLQRNCDAEKGKDVRGLVKNHRGFAKFVDEDKLKSYLSSFGASPTPAQSENHEVFKRSSMRKKKSKKVLTTTTETSEIEAPEIPTRPLKERNNGKNFSVSPRHVVHFELDDAKYSEEYEKLKKSRKLRVKRSADLGSKTNETKRTEKFITKDTFVQPREFFKFSLMDAVTKSSSTEAPEMKESEKKNKREIANDSTATDTKKIHVTHPMRGYGSTKHVSYDNIPSKLQKMIDSALNDAVQKGKAVEGDYLKFFYGDKIIKVPVSMAKFVMSKKEKETTSVVKESSSFFSNQEVKSYPKETSSYPKATSSYPKEILSYPKETTLVYGKKIVSEEPKTELKLLGTKNAYFSLKSSSINYEKPKFLPTLPTVEKPESYVNFGSSPIVAQPEFQENDYKKSVYFFSNDENKYYPKNSLSSPGPVLFEDSVTTPATIEAPKSYDYKSFIYHPKHGSVDKDATPITENVDETFEYIPSPPKKSYLPLPPPTSYIEYAGNHAESHDQSKNYEFGYHISDYKTGNNYGHQQKSNKDETKGQYSILLPDGRVQVVKYYADDSGFHADVQYTNVH